MIIEIVSFKIPANMSREEILTDAKSTLERWNKFPGLVRKTYVKNDKQTCMGVYLWNSKDAALEGHDDAWLDRAEAKWGNRPVIKYYDAFMELDNAHGDLLVFPEE